MPSAEGRPSRPRRRWPADLRARVTVLVALASVLGAAALVQQSTDAAFTATAASSAAFTSGSVVLTNDAGGGALLSLTGLMPGDTRTKCLTVTYAGTLDATIRLFGVTGGTGLAPYLQLRITRGSFGTPPGGGDCTGFTPDALDYTGSGAGVVYDGTLAAFAGSPAAAQADPLPGLPQAWVPGEAHAYQIDVTVAADNAAQGLTASTTLTWQAADVAPAASSPGAYAAAVLADAPSAYWRLGEALGASTAADVTGRHPGRYVGSPALGAAGALAGSADTALGLAGAEHVMVPWTTALGTPQYTLEAWARPTSTPSWGLVAGIWTGSGWNGSDLVIEANGDWGAFAGNAGVNPGTSIHTPATLGVWTHLVLVQDGTTVTFYVDGQLMGTGPAYHPGGTTTPFTIGEYTQDGTTWLGHFHGSIDEVAVYDHALTQARVQAHYAAAH